MSYPTVVIVRRDFTGETATRTVNAETIAGLMVHRDVNGKGWIVATKSALVVYGSYSPRLKTRAQAREAARYLAQYMPPEVKRGEWNGEQWDEHDPYGVRLFHAAVRGLKVKLSGF